MLGGLLVTGVVLAALQKYVSPIVSPLTKGAKAVSQKVGGVVGSFIEKITDKFLVNNVEFNIKWLRDDAKKKLSMPGIKSVAVGDLRRMVELYPTVPEWKALLENECTHIIATVGNDGTITGAEFIKDISEVPDAALDEFINRTGEGMVVISG